MMEWNNFLSNLRVFELDPNFHIRINGILSTHHIGITVNICPAMLSRFTGCYKHKHAPSVFLSRHISNAFVCKHHECSTIYLWRQKNWMSVNVCVRVSMPLVCQRLFDLQEVHYPRHTYTKIEISWWRHRCKN